MIKAELFKLEIYGWPCCNHLCLKKCHYKAAGREYIKPGTICLKIKVKESTDIYCYNCIDVIYKELKPVLDKKLWSFK